MLPFLRNTKSFTPPLFKNIAFSRVFKANGLPREFNFRRKITPEKIVYDIDVSDERGNRHYFSMHYTSGSWAVPEQFFPAWIIAAFPQIRTILDEAEASQSL
jgi:hypothetical protein